jgi:hypothetical protein
MSYMPIPSILLVLYYSILALPSYIILLGYA